MNPASNAYDYQNGRGLDGFLSAAIDEVSWETSLGTVLNTLSAAPIGQSAYSNTGINYDAAQISGSQSGTTTLGGSGGGAAGTGGSGNLQIDSTNNRITLSDGTNTRVTLGLQNDNTYGLKVSKPGADTSSSDLIFNSNQIIGTVTYNARTLSGSAGNTLYTFQSTIPHNLGYVPDYTVLVPFPKSDLIPSNFPQIFYIPIAGSFSTPQESTIMGYLYYSGVDSQNLYLALQLVNESGSPLTSIPVTIQYYIREVKAV